MNKYLEETSFLDFSEPSIREAVLVHSSPECTDKENAISLYYFVRDKIRYDPYSFTLTRPSYTASVALKEKHGFCISKAVLYAAVLRAAGIPSRLGFADVKNHLTSERLRKLMKTDMFYYHGYTEVYLDGKWVKATPAFNIELCEKAGTLPLEFDGESDSVFHSFSKDGSKHMEYINDHGSFDDVPFDEIIEVFSRVYGDMFSEGIKPDEGEFEDEVGRVK